MMGISPVTMHTCGRPNYDPYSKIIDCGGEILGWGATMEDKAKLGRRRHNY